MQPQPDIVLLAPNLRQLVLELLPPLLRLSPLRQIRHQRVLRLRPVQVAQQPVHVAAPQAQVVELRLEARDVVDGLELRRWARERLAGGDGEAGGWARGRGVWLRLLRGDRFAGCRGGDGGDAGDWPPAVEDGDGRSGRYCSDCGGGYGGQR